MSRKSMGAGTAYCDGAKAAMTSSSPKVTAGPERTARAPTGGSWDSTGSPVQRYERRISAGAATVKRAERGSTNAGLGQQGAHGRPQLVSRERLAQDRDVSGQLGLQVRR